MDLHDNSLSGELDTSFWNLSKLQVLDLSGNHITGSIPQKICSLASIEILDLSNNNLSGSIPRCASASLSSLNLYGNSLSGNISDDLFNTSNLMYLDMRHNKLTGNLNWLRHLDKIKALSLGWNDFEGQINPNLCKLKCPRIIDFSHNKLSGSLPPCVGNISCESDTAAQNYSPVLLIYVIIEAYITVHDPIDFTFATKGGQYTYGYNFFDLMSGIDLSGNMLSGEIPWELGNLSHIKSLNLSNNFFTGQIPASFANMSEIESLDLSHNELSGLIPWQLTKLSSLAVFSVAYNNLSGCIPNSGQFGTFGMDSYQGNSNLRSMSKGNICSPDSGAGDLPSEGRDSMADDPVLYAVSAASFVLAFWGTVAFLFFHPLGRHAILATGNLVFWCDMSWWLPWGSMAVVVLSVLQPVIYMSCGCLVEERAALMDIRSSLIRAGSTENVPRSWGRAEDCCSWERVKCDNFTRRVSQLNLSSISDVSWNINSAAFSAFHELQFLDLSENSLSSFSFDAFRNLQSLQELYLGGNGLNGTLPLSIFALPHLRILDLSQNSFEGGFPINSFSETVSLEVLDISYNSMGGNLPASLFSLPHIEVLNLSANLFEGPIPIGLYSNLPLSLKSIKLSQNSLSGRISFFWLRNLTKLQEIDLSANTNLAVDVNIAGWVPSFQLKQLTLSGCNLDRGIIAEPHFLCTQRHLEVLDLSYNNLSGSMPNWLFTEEATLIELDLGNNLLTGSLDPIWYPQTSLITISISINRIAGQLPANISSMFPSLSTLDFSNNNISGDIPISLCNIKSMQYLDLSDNKFSGELAACMFFEFTQLWTLKISNNQLGGLVLGGMNNLTIKLGILNLRNNKFEGTLPHNLSGHLTFLDLQDNKLSGNLDTSSWNLSLLQILNLANNRITGEIHPTICGLESIELMDLSNNNFEGSIPNCRQCPSQNVYQRSKRCSPTMPLRFLNVSMNSLSGVVPKGFFESSLVIALDLRYNHFTGNLDWIQYLEEIIMLFLGGNKFEGQIIPKMCRLEHLRLIDLSHNSLSGVLPACIGQIPFNYSYSENPLLSPDSVGIFYGRVLPDYRYDLKGFSFTTKGSLYTYSRSLFDLMSGIDLSGNLLSGEIPRELGNLSTIKSLNLSNNLFTGSIPATFANLRMIESLDLSHNKLSGQIPQQLTQLSTLEVFSVAYNNLSGCAPDSGQFGTFGMDSYIGNKGLQKASQGKGCTSSPGRGSLPKEDNKETALDVDDRDTVLYAVSAASFVLAFWATMAFVFCHPTGQRERAALMDIRSSLVRANYTTVPLSWGQDEECCSWERVRCDNFTRRVSELNLSNMSNADDNSFWELNITFLDLSLNYWMLLSFDGLTKLRFLYFTGNVFGGNFPSSLGNLVSLEVLDFSNSSMYGTLPSAAFKNLKNLQKLDLNKMDSNFDGLHGSLPASLFTLPHLKFLDLSGHCFEGSIPINSSSIPVSLEVLNLNHNLLNGTLPTEKALENLKNLRELNLSSNQFTGNIPRSLLSLPHIELLDLSGNLFQGPIPISSSSNLPVSLKSLRNLTKLEGVSLSGNDNLVVDINIPGWVPPFQLKQLELSGCDLDKNIITEPYFLRTQHHLEVLDLSNNNLSGSMPNWLFTERARIYWLDLRNNSLTGSLQSIWHPQNFLEYINVSMNRVADPLPENISSIFPNLVFLDFSNNKIHGHIPMELCQIRRLRHLDLSNNKISGELPACLFTGHTELMTLKVSKNKLGGPIFGGMDNLSFVLWYLCLDSNKYEGSMPQNISAQNLLLMDLHDNKLSGKLHTSFWNLPSLMALNLADNTLTGEIHPSFCNLTAIFVLDLSNNNLTGSIPNCSRTKQQLYFLNLSNNSLSGDISYAFFNISNLIAMDIRHNQFTGNLSWVYSLKINILSLGGNNFEGQISPDICNLQFLRIIDFSHNKLSGSVPACVGSILFNNVEDGDERIFLNHFRLADIEMHDSDLSTTYYDLGFAFSTKGYQYAYGFNFVTMMSGIDLSANMLDGEIPWQLGNLSHIKSLNLSYNFFTGQIPATFANMKEVESLDLSHNNLSGPIPWQLTHLGHPQCAQKLCTFSVAYNNLSGCIPNYGQLASFNMEIYATTTFTIHHSRCSPSGHVSKEEDVEERYDDPVLYIVNAASFVLAFCATVAFSFCHSYGRSVILKMKAKYQV
uniref:non-specific serine/threonine protein kinase n=1 Tax=Oryza meridionalis TaxID=40149 RepID=A0A0E0DJ56_9ORYZ